MRFVALVLPALLLAGCSAKNAKMPKMKDLLPKAAFNTFKVDSIDFEGAETVFVFDVQNPYPVGLELQQLNWKFGVAGHPLLDGAKDKGIDIDPGATSKVRIPVGVKFADVFAVATDAKGKGEVPWTIEGDFAFDTPIGPIQLPFNEAGVMPALTAPRIKLGQLRMGKLDLKAGTVGMELDLDLESDEEKPVSFEAFDYGISFAGNEVLKGAAQMAKIEGGTGKITIPIDLQLVELGATVVETLTKKGELKVGLNADAKVATPIGAIPLKIDKSKKLQIK